VCTCFRCSERNRSVCATLSPKVPLRTSNQARTRREDVKDGEEETLRSPFWSRALRSDRRRRWAPRTGCRGDTRGHSELRGEEAHTHTHTYTHTHTHTASSDQRDLREQHCFGVFAHGSGTSGRAIPASSGRRRLPRTPLRSGTSAGSWLRGDTRRHVRAGPDGAHLEEERARGTYVYRIARLPNPTGSRTGRGRHTCRRSCTRAHTHLQRERERGGGMIYKVKNNMDKEMAEGHRDVKVRRR